MTSTRSPPSAKLLPANWQSRLPHNSTPYTSTIVFLVRKGNPWKIKDWGDLVKPASTSSPPTQDLGRRALELSGRLGLGLKQPGGNPAKAEAFVTKLFKNVPVLDTGARGATTTFTQRGIGDVLLSWENEAYLAQENCRASSTSSIRRCRSWPSRRWRWSTRTSTATRPAPSPRAI
jgi:sulfate/thiosulfate-binding protein